MEKHEFTIKIMRQKMRALESDGWRKVLSVMSDSGDKGTEFGTLYVKDGNKFYLNYKTADLI